MEALGEKTNSLSDTEAGEGSVDVSVLLDQTKIIPGAKNTGTVPSS
jgi:hypothetical protein